MASYGDPGVQDSELVGPGGEPAAALEGGKLAQHRNHGVVGSLVGSLVYLALITDPDTQLLTPEWPAPAVATWKAVAETLGVGLSGIPSSALIAMAVAGIIGIVLALVMNAQRARSTHVVEERRVDPPV